MRPWIPLVMKVAMTLKRRLPFRVDPADLVSAGLQAVEGAARKYDPFRGVKFSTYCAFRVRGAMLDFLRKTDPIPRLARQRIRKHMERGKPLPAHLAVLEAPVTSIEQTPFDQVDRSAKPPVDLASNSDLLARVRKLLGKRKSLIVERHFISGHTLKEIAVSFGLSESRICQIVYHSIRKLRECLQAS